MVRVQGAALLFTALVVSGLSSSACGGSSEPARGEPNAVASSTDSTDSAEIRDVHAIYRSRCGSCHVRVEPGTHTRTELETAFSRHHTRVKMNDAEWSSMVDFLASDPSNNARATSRSTAK